MKQFKILLFSMLAVLLAAGSAHATLFGFSDASTVWGTYPGFEFGFDNWGNDGADLDPTVFDDITDSIVGLPGTPVLNFNNVVADVDLSTGLIKGITVTQTTGSHPLWPDTSPGDLFINVIEPGEDPNDTSFGGLWDWDFVVDLTASATPDPTNPDPGPDPGLTSYSYDVHAVNVDFIGSGGEYSFSPTDFSPFPYDIRDSHPVGYIGPPDLIGKAAFSGWSSTALANLSFTFAFDDPGDAGFNGIPIGTATQFIIGWTVNNATDVIYGTIDLTTGAPIPEPATMFLFGIGMIGLAGFGRKRLFKKA